MYLLKMIQNVVVKELEKKVNEFINIVSDYMETYYIDLIKFTTARSISDNDLGDLIDLITAIKHTQYDSSDCNVICEQCSILLIFLNTIKP